MREGGKVGLEVFLTLKKETHEEIILFASERLPRETEKFKIRLIFVYLGWF